MIREEILLRMTSSFSVNVYYRRKRGREKVKRMIWLTVICAALFFVLSAFSCAFADVIINEVMASNGFYENGEAYDWIELYNDGKKAVDLGGWYLSDSKKNPLKWSFPRVQS